MKIRPRRHGPTGRDWVSIGLSPREARALPDGDERSAVRSNRPDIVFRAAA